MSSGERKCADAGCLLPRQPRLLLFHPFGKIGLEMLCVRVKDASLVDEWMFDNAAVFVQSEINYQMTWKMKEPEVIISGNKIVAVVK